jgi:FXSXX-COOH protein
MSEPSEDTGLHPEDIPRPASGGVSEPNPPLVDISGISLADIPATNGTVLAHALRRVLDDVERSGESISGWSSYVN